MTDLLGSARVATLNSIERRRDESSVVIPPRDDLDALAAGELRHLASGIRAGAWGDRTSSAEESEDDFNDLGWAPSAAVRAAALIDHLAELSTGVAVSAGTIDTTVPETACPPTGGGGWSRASIQDLTEQLDAISVEDTEILIFDAEEKVCIARATSWRGEIVEIVDLLSLPERRKKLQAILQGQDKAAKSVAKLGAWRREA